MDGAPTTAAPVRTGLATDEAETKKAVPESSPKPVETYNIPEKVRNFTDEVLNFLSNASNETLGACALGLFASTYLILGRVGLVLIGAVSGIVLHATWENTHDDRDGTQDGLQKSASRRKELGVEIAKRILDWRDRRGGPGQEAEEESIRFEPSLGTRSLEYSEFRQATRAALTSLTDAIIRDYVKYGRPELFFAFYCTDSKM